MRKDYALSVDDRQPATGWRIDFKKRVYENDVIVAFIDLLGTQRLYNSNLTTEDQAKMIFKSLLVRFDIKFCECFSTKEIQENFDVSIFGDSIVISEKRRIPKIIERLVEFLLKYQAYLFKNYYPPSRVILTRDSFFSFKIKGASKQSILGSSNTSISLCGGRSIASAHHYLKGLPIGVYVTEKVKPELTAEQQVRIIPVQHMEKYPDLFFIKNAEGINLPEETSSLLTEKPEANPKEIIDSVKAALQDNDTPNGLAGILEPLLPGQFLKPALQNQDAFDDKWVPWILVHLGKQKQIVRKCSSKSIEDIEARP